MRALSTATFAHAAGVVFFRDPRPRVAVVVKLTLALSEGAGGVALSIASVQSAMVPGIDLVPRKSRVELLVTGDAFSTEATTSIPVEMALGSSLRFRANATSLGGRAAYRAPLEGTGPTPLRLTPTPPRSPREALFSDAWIDVPPEGLQVAPPAQQSTDLITFGAPLSLFNLTDGGGVVVTRLPSLAAYAFLVDAGAQSSTHRVAMRLDTLLFDTVKARIDLTLRGELEIDRFAACPSVVLGLGAPTPGGPNLEVALRDGAPIGLTRVRQRNPHRPPAETLHRIDEEPARASLPFIRSGATQPDTAENKVGGGDPRVASLPPLFSIKRVGPWQIERQTRCFDDRSVCDVVHSTLAVKGELVVLDRESAKAPERVLQFERAVTMRQRVTDACLVPVLDRGRTVDGIPYVVDALPRGRSLCSVIAGGGSAGLSTKRALGLLEQVLVALAPLHRAGLVHGSISPRAIFVAGDTVELLPLATLRETGLADAPAAGLHGDPAFSSPEVALGDWSAVDARADVWSAAALVVDMITRRPLHRRANRQKLLLAAMTTPAPPIASLVSELDSGIAAVLDRALAFSREGRPSDAGAFIDELERAGVSSMYGPLPRADDEPVGDDGPPTIDPRATRPLLEMADVLPPNLDADDAMANEATHDRGPRDSHDTLPPLPIAADATPWGDTTATPAVAFEDEATATPEALGPTPEASSPGSDAGWELLTVDVDALAAIACAAYDERAEVVESLGLDDVTAALAFGRAARQIDREVESGNLDALARLLSALHDRALRKA